MSSLITPEGVLSYPKVFKSELPHNSRPGDKKAWSTTILFRKDATETPEFKALVKAAVDCAVEGFGQTVSRKVEWFTEGKEKDAAYLRLGDNGDTIRLPFRRDIAKKGYPADFAIYLNTRSVDNPDKATTPPQVIGRNAKPIEDMREIYPGVRARVSLGVFHYDTSGNKGVSFGLRNVQKLGDGQRIDNRQDAKDEFGAMEPEPAGAMPGEDLNSLVA